MVFMGSKNKYKKYIIPIINKYIRNNKIKDFYDVFCGGANLIDSIICENLYANDLSPTLIALHKQMQIDSSVFPETGSRLWWDDAYKDYKRLINNFPIDYKIWEKEALIPLWQIGAIEWYSSFTRGGFPRGYAKAGGGRDYYKEGLKNHLEQMRNTNYKKIHFSQGSYKNINIPENALIYCDAPYRNTKPYSINPKFNYEEYYNWLKEKSKTNPIFISEQEMPEGFNIIWEMEVKRTAGRNHQFTANERLYFIDNRNN